MDDDGKKRFRGKPTGNVLTRYGVSLVSWPMFADDLTPDQIIRSSLSISDKAKDRTAVLVSILKSGERPKRQPTPKAIAAAINGGLIDTINGVDTCHRDGGETTAKYNTDGVTWPDGKLATKDIPNAIFG